MTMTSITDVIEAFELKAKQRCNPSMDGRREAYYDGRKDAYLDCANILRTYLAQFQSKI